jgi:hypothetical protein
MEGNMTRQELMENISKTIILMQKTYRLSSEQLAKRIGVTPASSIGYGSHS